MLPFSGRLRRRPPACENSIVIVTHLGKLTMPGMRIFAQAHHSEFSEALKGNTKQEGSKKFPDKLGSLSANVPNHDYRCLHCFHS